MTSKLLVFDPGPHTGVALFVDQQLLDSQTLDMKQIGVEVQYNAIGCLIRSLYDEFMGMGGLTSIQVVCERFRPHNAIGATNDAVHAAKVAGFVEGMCACFAVPFRWQDPSYRKGAMLQAKTLPHKSKHELDAIAHGLAYFTWLRSAGAV